MSNHNRRQDDGDETWNRLKEWIKGSKSAERLASHILSSDGFLLIDPSHPLGGRDGNKDLICFKDKVTWIGAVYFPRGQKTFREIKVKFINDIAGIGHIGASGLVFVTNQEISVAQRKSLISLAPKHSIMIYHLERIVNLLNNPKNYGVRLEFLNISMSEEEQLAYFAERDREFLGIVDMLKIDNIKKSVVAYQQKLFLIKELIEDLQAAFDEIDSPASSEDYDKSWEVVVKNEYFLNSIKSVVLNEIDPELALKLYGDLKTLSSVKNFHEDIQEAERTGQKYFKSKAQLQDHYSGVIQKSLFEIVDTLENYEMYLSDVINKQL